MLPRSTNASLVLILSTMNNTAPDIQEKNPLELEGLEEIFIEPVTIDNNDEDKPDNRDRSDKNNSDAADSPDISEIDDSYWTPEMAAEHFKVSVRTIRRRLKKGSIKGFKVTGKNGPEWKIEPVTMDNPDEDKLVSADSRDRSDKNNSDAADSPVNDSVTVDAKVKETN